MTTTQAFAELIDDMLSRISDLENRLATHEDSTAPAVLRPERIWNDTRQAADHAGKHPATLLKALEAGDLHGHQRVKNGRWSIHSDCLAAWLGDATCPRHPDGNV